jgi:hypothetical protein
MWYAPPIPTFCKSSFSFFGEHQGSQSFNSILSGGSTISTSSDQVGLARKNRRLEVYVSGAQPKAVTMNQLSQSTEVGNACATRTGSQTCLQSS